MASKRKIKKDNLSVLFVTGFLLTYCILLQFGATQGIAFIMLMVSPFLVIWMVYTVLKDGKYEGGSLGEDEFGYSDKSRDELGMF